MAVNFHKVEQLIEQSTTSTTFVDIPGTTLTFTPNNVSETWMIFASGVIRSSVTVEQPYEITLLINSVEHDLWSHQNSNASTPNGAGFLVFDRIIGVEKLQTVKLQYKALSGTCYADNVRVIAARVPDNADFQYTESDGIVTDLGTNLDVGSLTFTPESAGNYYFICSIKHREHPSGSTSQAWFEGTDAVLHPNAPTGTYHSCARESWNPTTYIWRENLTAVSKTVKIRFTSSGLGKQNSEHRYRKIMAFREDAWDDADYDLTAAQTSTTGTTFVSKNSVTVGAPPEPRDYLSFQTARIGGTNSATGQKSGELRIGGTAKVRTDHHINRDGGSTQGYHHTIGLVDAANQSTSITYENGFLSPSAITVECAESAIVVLRYAGQGNTHQIII